MQLGKSQLKLFLYGAVMAAYSFAAPAAEDRFELGHAVIATATVRTIGTSANLTARASWLLDYGMRTTRGFRGVADS